MTLDEDEFGENPLGINPKNKEDESIWTSFSGDAVGRVPWS